MSDAVVAPRANPLLLGHEAAEATLIEAARAGRLHHAWLIAGPAGIGKATLAFRFARWLLAGAPSPSGARRDDAGEGAGLALDPAHPVFRRVAAGSHADLLTIERGFDDKRKRQRREILVEDVRVLGGFLRLTPAEGGWRVVVVDGAEALNRNAANALLKLLEEPPPRAILLLVCSAPGRLLPTLRSRCRTLRLAPLAAPVMAALLGRLLPETAPAERARLAALAEGAPGRALALAEEDGLRLAGLVAETLAALPALTPDRAHEIADRVLAGEEGGFEVFADLLRDALARALREAGRGGSAPAWLAARPLEAWAELWHAIGRLQDETGRFYLDKRQATLMTLFRAANLPGVRTS